MITDTLGVAQSPNAKETVFMFETVSKNLGFNAAGKRLPTPAQQPWRPNEAQRAIIAEMRGPFLTASSSYIFISKAKIIALHDAGKMSDTVFDRIREIARENGLDWDTLGDSYEKYTLGDRSWESP